MLRTLASPCFSSPRPPGPRRCSWSVRPNPALAWLPSGSALGLRRILALKRRPMHKGMIVVGANWAQLALCHAARVNRRVWSITGPPGHLLLPASRRVLPLLRGRHRKLAVRITAHPETARACRLLGQCAGSTSANLARPARAENARLSANVWRRPCRARPDWRGASLQPLLILQPGVCALSRPFNKRPRRRGSGNSCR